MIRVLIADDELPARQRVRQLLATHPDFEVVAEAESGAQAMELSGETKPDLLLLDIEMGQGSGLDVAACLPAPRPAIIFCTAFDQYAVDAFELNALDYLMKPVSRVRLEKALERFSSQRHAEVDTAVDNMLRQNRQHLLRFLVRNGPRYLVVPGTETAYLESVDGLTRLVTNAGNEYWMDPSLQEIEVRVDPEHFFRISRAAIINVDAVVEVQSLPGGNAVVVLKNKAQLDVSRRRVRDLLSVLERG